jgi:amino acid adenylation domain-containing protein
MQSNRKSIADRLLEAAHRFSARTAVSCFKGSASETWSYERLTEYALKMGAWLLNNSPPTTPLLVCAEKAPQAYGAILGAIYSGRPFIPLSPRTPALRQEEIFELLKPATPPSSQEVLAVRGLSAPELTQASDLAYVIFTSGSTGKPKAIAISQSNFSAFLDSSENLWKFSPDDRISQIFEFGFDPAISDMLWAFTNGACLCPLPLSSLPLVSDYISKERITVWSSSPSLLKLALSSGAIPQDAKFPLIRWSSFIGEQLGWDLLNQWRSHAQNSRMENHYGPAEATISVSHYVVEGRPLGESVPIGLAHPNHRMEIVNSNLQRVLSDESGELVIAGPQVSPGYLNDSEKTAQKFRRFSWDPDEKIWYRTGDLVRRDRQGQLEFIARLDRQVKIRGVRLELGEVESGLAEALGQGRVLGVFPWPNPGASSGEGVIALLNQSLSAAKIAEVQHHLGQILSPTAIPSEYFFVAPQDLERLMNLSGKLDSRLVAEAIADHTAVRCG